MDHIVKKIDDFYKRLEKSNKWKIIQPILVDYGATIAFIFLISFNILFTPNFFQISTFLLIIKQTTSLIFVAVGMTILISMGGTDISVGSIMAFSGILIVQMLVMGMNFYVSIILAFIICALVGTFNGVIISKVGIQPIILTLVMQIVLRGFTVMLAKSTVIPLHKYKLLYRLGIMRVAGDIPIQVFFFAFAVIIAFLLIKKSVFGKYIEAIGSSRKAAHLTGIRTDFIMILAYILSALFASFAGLLEMSRTAALDPNLLGKNFELDAIASVAIGGTSMAGGKAHVLGTIMGCVIMTMIGTTVNMNNVPFAVSNIIKAGIIVFSLAIQHKSTD